MRLERLWGTLACTKEPSFLTSEISIWFLYQMTVGLGVACVRQCR